MEMVTMMRSAVVATKMAIILAALIGSSSCDSVEGPQHWCGQLATGGWGRCDPGHCCSIYFFCGKDPRHCGPGNCAYYCDQRVGDDDHGGVAVTGLVNATHKSYLDVHDDDMTTMIKAATSAATNGSSSSPSVLPSSLSCAASLSRLPPASCLRYPWAGFRDAVLPTNVTNCGRCLQVTSFGAGGGIHDQVKVRVVHEGTMEGLELDRNVFHQLDMNGHATTENHFMVKYQFESC